jgi:NAD/NADP transhydrogenase beta subunit
MPPVAPGGRHRGVDNPLLYKDNTVLPFGGARTTVKTTMPTLVWQPGA